MFDESLRRSSVSAGIGTRTTFPSFVGFSPRSEVRMALSISGSAPGSHGAKDNHRRVWDRQSPELVHRHRGSVIIDADLSRSERWRGPCALRPVPCGNLRPPFPSASWPAPARLCLWQFHGAHQTLPVEFRILSRGNREPTSSPMTTRFKLPATFMLNTMMGILLSMHSEIAVESITDRPFCSTSR